MKETDPRLLVRQGKGLLLDTNILLLAVIGSFGSESVLRFSRTAALFDQEDLSLLERVLNCHKTLWTTPHVLTETSNFLGYLKGTIRTQARERLREFVSVYHEHWEKAASVLEDKDFMQLGLGDAAISQATRNLGVVLLSTDYELCQTMLNRSIPAVNFRHLRDMQF